MPGRSKDDGDAITGGRTRRVSIVAAPLRKQVVELLREAIVSSEFKPGQRLVERDLCARFDVSRTVIREALRHLEAEGLVEVVANRGPIVSILSYDEVRAMYEVREALESLAARYCAVRATPAQKSQLADAVAAFEEACARGSLADELQAKDEFYRILCEGAKNPVVASMLRTIQTRVQMLRSLSLGAPGRPQRSLAELKLILEAIEEGDGERAAERAATHVRNAGSTALERLAELEGRAPERLASDGHGARAR
ncbi:MAG TPA: GntR family transcriptional regulator [Candidatus Dormibacteraeota bacterium]|nr:GntR family transcriptional regulator [Candidatus Dormibacteraeota bacterium]